ncbi:MAG: 50S ribosomal protein L1 [Patescibacteria group bacterium]
MAKKDDGKKSAMKKKDEDKKISRGIASQKKVFRGKKYKEVKKFVDTSKVYQPLEAIEIAKKVSFAKFGGSLEVHLRIGVDTKKPEQMVRGTVNLPNGLGKVKRIVFLGLDEKDQKDALNAGAIKSGGEDLIEEINNGFIDFDVVVATPNIMPKITKLARILGPKGLMPTPKAGTVSTNPVQTISELNKGKLIFKVDKLGIIHAAIGKISFDSNALLENLIAFFLEVKRLKPVGQKGIYFKSLSLAPTMGPSVRVDMTSLIGK